MCGIFGAVGRDLTDSPIRSIFEMLHHRGPDGRGQFRDAASKVTIVHTRLAVIDLDTGAQPLESEDGSIVLAVNGEIYDFERIRSELEAKGHRFRTRSDSEVILHLYRQFGLGCFDHLRGEFAFLLYDRAKRIFIAARDRFGIKPLYLARLPGAFVFASEMKAIFASGLLEPKLNAAAFDPLIDQDPADARLPFEGVEHVPPASYVLIDLETSESRMARYWSGEIPAASADPVVEPSEDRRKACARSVLHQLEEAVRLRLRADVPVGLYLSGGLDSALVGALMERNLASRLHSFSISFEGSRRNEREFAHLAAGFLGTEHHELSVGRNALWDNLEECLWHSELPFVTLAPVGKFLLSREARKFVTVVLTGEGADEVFLGYRSFFQKAIHDTRSGRGTKKASAQLRRLKLGRLATALLQRFSLLLFEKRRRPELAQARNSARHRTPPAKPLINAVQEARIAGMPLDILCYLGDREEMAHSLEARLPFLDHELYDVAKDIPVDFKVQEGVEKAVLRDAAAGILPDDLRLRRKTGFMATSEVVDFFGSDRRHAQRFERYLSREAFRQADVFSYRSYLLATLLSRLPERTRRLKRLRRSSNKLIMYMMQVHMLHDMFVAHRRWATREAPPQSSAGSAREEGLALVS